MVSKRNVKKVSITTFFKKKRKGEHNGHNCFFGKVFARKVWSFLILDIFKNVHFRKPLAKCRFLVFCVLYKCFAYAEGFAMPLRNAVLSQAIEVLFRPIAFVL